MHPKRKQKLIFILAGLALVGSAVGLVLYANTENMSWFRTPTEIATGDYVIGQSVRVGGLVKVGSVARADQGLETSFTLTDGANEVKVTYDKIMPDLFREGQGIVAEGKVVEGVLVASEVLAKHDENYMPAEAAEALERAGHPMGMGINQEYKEQY